MQSIKIAALAAAAILSTIAVASAADLRRPGPPPAPVYVPPPAPVALGYDWSGAYLGVQGGYDWNRGSAEGFTAEPEGGLLGIYGGYNAMLSPSFLIGLDASINYDWAKTDSTTPAAPVDISAGPDWKGFIRGRLGLAMGQFLIYGTAGGAYAHVKISSSQLASSATGSPFGWTAGGGVEVAISRTMTARLDYAYEDYGSFTVNGSGFFDGASVSAIAHTVTAGVAFKY